MGLQYCPLPLGFGIGLCCSQICSKRSSAGPLNQSSSSGHNSLLWFPVSRSLGLLVCPTLFESVRSGLACCTRVHSMSKPWMPFSACSASFSLLDFSTILFAFCLFVGLSRQYQWKYYHHHDHSQSKLKAASHLHCCNSPLLHCWALDYDKSGKTLHPHVYVPVAANQLVTFWLESNLQIFSLRPFAWNTIII